MAGWWICADGNLVNCSDSCSIRTSPFGRKRAYAIGVRLSAAKVDVDLVTGAAAELQACLLRETDPNVQGLILEDLGVALYGTDEERNAAETFIVQQAHGMAPRILGAMKGLAALFRQHPERPVQQVTRERLRQLVVPGVESNEPGIRRVALQALQTANDTDVATLRAVARDEDWQVRRLLAGRLDLSNAEQAPLAWPLEQRHCVSGSIRTPVASSRLATSTGLCAPIIRHIKDPSPIVQMRAMDVLVAKCTDLDDILPTLIDLADRLDRPASYEQWHLPSRALANLARIKPEEARPRLGPALKHPVWQVRAAAAESSVPMQDEAAALALAADREPNVRTAALDALFRLRSPAVVPQAIAVLELRRRTINCCAWRRLS